MNQFPSQPLNGKQWRPPEAEIFSTNNATIPRELPVISEGGVKHEKEHQAQLLEKWRKESLVQPSHQSAEA